MTHIQLPISKSIANRLLMLQAINGLPLLDVSSSDMPEDVRTMHDGLVALHNGADYLMLDNCGTAMRFLTAYCAQLEGRTTILDGNARMRQRPIGQLVDALLACGADIEYQGKAGFPPIKVIGEEVNGRVYLDASRLDSTQFVSALLLIGLDVTCEASSPYIEMTRKLVEKFTTSQIHTSEYLERDWSAAAFWYEYVALHGGELLLEGLQTSELQGDCVVADIFGKLGVETLSTPEGAVICRKHLPLISHLHLSFADCPDLYPAVAITCRQLDISLEATDIERLRWKESDRLSAVEHLRTDHDHRMAMALLAADLPCDDMDCIAKSYPTFYSQLCQLR